MLNNRLILNGNFGYRESYYSTNNFIGDFDIRYILTRNGDISLKAYNQTNDRYFVQSSLTTQGLGIQFKRDFNNWKEAFRKQKTKMGTGTGTSTGTGTKKKMKKNSPSPRSPEGEGQGITSLPSGRLEEASITNRH